jgi:L-malate glycosyltransferase
VLPAWYPTERAPFDGSFVRDHVRAAAAYGHRMVVLVDDGPAADMRGLVSLSEERDGEIRVIRLAYRPAAIRVAGVLATLRVAWRLRREGTPVDVIHAHVHRMGWVAVLAGMLLRRPVVITEHSSEWPGGLMSPPRLRRAKFALEHATLVCPVNRRLRDAIEAYGVRARFRIVPNTVDTSVFHAGSSSRIVASPRLVNVARHVEVKGLDVLLQAFAVIAEERANATLEMVGDGPLTQSLTEFAAELGVADRVNFVGAARPTEIADRLRSCDAFVLSSHSENMPLAVLEALCCGLPVAATDVGGVPEAVGADGVLAPSGDVAALADAVRSVLSDLGRFDRSGIARRAAARWSFEAVGGIWDEIYESVASDPS